MTKNDDGSLTIDRADLLALLRPQFGPLASLSFHRFEGGLYRWTAKRANGTTVSGRFEIVIRPNETFDGLEAVIELLHGAS
jgi:hypothetical protein